MVSNEKHIPLIHIKIGYTQPSICIDHDLSPSLVSIDRQLWEGLHT